jgi:hypothetical protein
MNQINFMKIAITLAVYSCVAGADDVTGIPVANLVDTSQIQTITDVNVTDTLPLSQTINQQPKISFEVKPWMIDVGVFVIGAAVTAGIGYLALLQLRSTKSVGSSNTGVTTEKASLAGRLVSARSQVIDTSSDEEVQDQ